LKIVIVVPCGQFNRTIPDALGSCLRRLPGWLKANRQMPSWRKSHSCRINGGC
jgi:hypothetical protein